MRGMQLLVPEHHLQPQRSSGQTVSRNKGKALRDTPEDLNKYSLKLFGFVL